MNTTLTAPSATTVAIDLAKDVFELAYVDADGRIVARQRLGRSAFAKVFDNRAPLRLVMEACGSAHYWGRRFRRLGHGVELLPAHDVRPYVHRTKTDRADAAGLWEAARCAAIRPVPVKTVEQQGIQGLHRAREFHKAQRTAAINLLRGLLREFGVVIPAGAAKVRPAVLAALEDAETELPMALRETLLAVLDTIATARTLALTTLRVLRANLYWAIAYNLSGIPLAAFGLVPPWLAAIGMSASSLFVVLNSLRIAPPQASSPCAADAVPAFAEVLPA